MLFSATMPGPIVTLARTFLNRPTHIRAEQVNDSAVHDRTTQFVYRAHALDKAELVARILQAEGRGATMIFTRTNEPRRRWPTTWPNAASKWVRCTATWGRWAREKAPEVP